MFRPLAFAEVRVAHIAPFIVDVMTRVADPVTVLGGTALGGEAFPNKSDPHSPLLSGFMHEVALVKGSRNGDMLSRGVSRAVRSPL